MLPVYLNRFDIIKPKNCVAQDKLLKWIIECHQLAEKNNQGRDPATRDLGPELLEKLFNRYAVAPDQISQRYVESDDVLSSLFKENIIYKIDEQNFNGSDILVRSQFFSERVYEVFQKFYGPSAEHIRPDHIIHVTCTGYVSPSAAQRIVCTDNWQHKTDITHAYHMGCYASLPAVRMARSLVISETEDNRSFRTDIIHNELCGLHMNVLAQTPEQMVVQTLFADGHIKYSASGEKEDCTQNLLVIAVLEKTVPNSEQDMSWIPAPWGMQMSLSREVPQKIKPELEAFTHELLDKAHLSRDVMKTAVFAVHPGGPKIIESVKESLNLNNQQIVESKKILFERGNMSSATLPHIWNEILNNQYPSGTKVISLAFGPGLTIFGSVFEVC